MARKQKTILGQINSAPAHRQFTDREEPQAVFEKALADVNNRDYSILTYYGVGGIGKSSLQKHLKEDHLDNNADAIYSWIDFDLEANRTPQKALRTLAKNFREKFKLKFTVFDIAYVIYWSKAFPDYDIKKSGLPFLEEGGLVADAIDSIVDAGGYISLAVNIISKVTSKAKKISFDIEIQEELKKLNVLEADEIEKKLAFFFAYDIDIYKKKNPTKKVVIFLDTYEALWDKDRSEANRLTKDEWVRNGLVEELQNVLFVICGREKIRWVEVDEEWEDDLDQHILGDLSKEDAKLFLISCEITDTLIQDKIIESSEGVPYYLDLCVDTFYQIKNSDRNPTTDNFKDVDKGKIFERFMRYLNSQEQETLKILANTRFYTKELFALLIEKFKTGYPVTAIFQLNDFSFISEEDGKFLIHDLMRKSLISFQSDELNDEVNSVLFEYYNSKLLNLNIKNILEECINALPEAFYHKERMGDVEALFKWYAGPCNIFEEAARYKDILETTIRLKEILEDKLGEDHPYTATSYDVLARLYNTQADFESALPLFKKALTIRKKILGETDLYTADSYNNLASFYYDQGKYDEAFPLFENAIETSKYRLNDKYFSIADSYNNLADLRLADSYNNLANLYFAKDKNDKALPLYEKALTIRKKILGEEHSDIADSYANLGRFYNERAKYEKSLPMLKKALAIREKIVGEDHPNTATSYDNLASYYANQDNYKEAFPLFEKALVIREKVLGKEHHHVAVSYNNLAGLYYAQGKYEEAVPLLKKALIIDEKTLGEEHPDMEAKYNNLATLYYAQEKYAEALPLFKKSLEMNIKKLGYEHIRTADSYSNLAGLYYAQGKYKEVLPLLKKELVIRKKVLGKGHPVISKIQEKIRNIKKVLGKKKRS